VPMRVQPRGAFVAGLAVLALAVAITVQACDDVPVNVDAQAVLRTTSANMKQLSGFHFVYGLHQPESARKAEGVQQVEADFNAQGEMQATVEYLASGALIDIDLIALVGTHYVRYPLSPSWVEMKPEDSPLTKLNLADAPVQILDKVTSASCTGIEKRQGQKTYHITGQVSKEAIEGVAGTVSTAEVFDTDLWIGVKDSLLYEVDVTGPMTTEEAPGTWRSIVLSKLGIAVDIGAPK
jgi:hypothetical protein